MPPTAGTSAAVLRAKGAGEQSSGELVLDRHVYTVKTIAEAFAEALYHRFSPPRVAATWVDGVIAASADPEPALIEAAFSAKNRPRLIAALHEVSGEADPQSSVRLLIGHMHRHLLANPSAIEAVAHHLYLMAIGDRVPASAASGAMLWFWDALDLARRGIHGDPELVRTELLAFLDEYGDAV